MPDEAGPVPESSELPLSPELVLVSEPEQARVARELLPEVPGKTFKRAAPRERAAENGAPPAPPPPRARPQTNDWDEFLADLRAREMAVADVEVEPTTPVRATRSRLMIGGIVILGVATAAAVFSLRHDGAKQVRSPSPPTSAQPPTTTGRTMPTAPTAPAHTSPTRTTPSSFVPARVWSWSPRRGARGYVVRFFRDGREVLHSQTARPRYVVPKSFTFRPGRYRWTVTAIGSGSKAPLVESQFVVS